MRLPAGLTWRRLVYPGYLAVTVAVGLEIGTRLLFPEVADSDRLMEGAYRRVLNSYVHAASAQSADFGFQLRPNTQRELRRGQLRYTVITNSAGFRGREPAPREPGEYRILLLGDSMVFGDGLQEDETIAVQLERAGADLERPVTVFNGALSGMNTVQELLVIRHLAPVVQPDHVVLGYFVSNDPLPNTISHVDGDGRFSLDEGAAQRLRTRLRQSLAPMLTSHALRTVLLPFFVPRLRSTWSASPAVIARSCALIGEVAAASRAADAVFSTVILYGREGTAGGPSDWWSGSRAVGLRLGRCLSERGIEVLDATAFMDGRADRNECYFPRDGHLNPSGARRVAEAIAGRLVRPRLETPDSG